MYFKMSSGKWRPFCVGLNVLKFQFKISRLFSSKAGIMGARKVFLEPSRSTHLCVRSIFMINDTILCVFSVPGHRRTCLLQPGHQEVRVGSRLFTIRGGGGHGELLWCSVGLWLRPLEGRGRDRVTSSGFHTFPGKVLEMLQWRRMKSMASYRQLQYLFINLSMRTNKSSKL